jgi:peptidoglycan lytic transglycosylase
MKPRRKAESERRKGFASEAGSPFILHPSSFILAAGVLAIALGGCGSVPTRETPPLPPAVSKAPPSVPGTRPGGYYLDDGPGDNPPANLDSIAEPTPRIEPLHRAAARPYMVMGRDYTPMTALAPYKSQGLATWYGRRYHGKQTSTGEIYDMYAMTAAHPTLPLPSYARVTHLKTGKSIVVRVNDRGPFYEGRIIDLSYTAAHRLGILGGATMVEVESIIPGSGSTIIATQSPARSPNQQAGTVIATPPREMATGSNEMKPAAPGSGISVITPAAAEPLPVPTAAPVYLPVTSEAGRVYLQMGAFGSRENAETYLARLKAQADWLALQVFVRDGLFRVQAGPYADRTEAQQVTDRLSQALGVKPIVLTR